MHFMGDSCQLHQSALLLRYSKLRRFYCRLSLFFSGRVFYGISAHPGHFAGRGLAQLVLLPPSINALSTPAQVLEQEQHLAQAMSYITIAAENHPSLKADPAYQRCMEAANCYSRMVYTSSLIYNDSVTRLNCALEQKRLGLLAGLLGIAPREYLQFAPDAPVACPVQPSQPFRREPA